MTGDFEQGLLLSASSAFICTGLHNHCVCVHGIIGMVWMVMAGCAGWRGREATNLGHVEGQWPEPGSSGWTPDLHSRISCQLMAWFSDRGGVDWGTYQDHGLGRGQIGFADRDLKHGGGGQRRKIYIIGEGRGIDLI